MIFITSVRPRGRRWYVHILTNFIVFGVTLAGLEPMIYRNRGEPTITPKIRSLTNTNILFKERSNLIL